jgi:hypothetical protein
VRVKLSRKAFGRAGERREGGVELWACPHLALALSASSIAHLCLPALHLCLCAAALSERTGPNPLSTPTPHLTLRSAST